MKRPKRIFLAGLLAAALGGFVWLVLRPHEPVYKGKPLSFWLQGYAPVNPSLPIFKTPTPPTRQEADEAIHQIGTNAIPTLLRMLQERDTQLEAKILRLLQKQHLIRIPFVHEVRNTEAYLGFVRLGSEASNAVPRLIEMFDSDPSPNTQQAIPVIFGSMGTAAAPAIPALMRGITNNNERVRNNAIYALGQIHTTPTLVVPALITCLSEPDAMVQAQAANSLGKFGEDAQSAVPALLELLDRQGLEAGRIGGSFSDPIANALFRRAAHLPISFHTLADVTKEALRAIDPAALSDFTKEALKAFDLEAGFQ